VAQEVEQLPSKCEALSSKVRPWVPPKTKSKKPPGDPETFCFAG
jgi:hypothetical protein